MTNDATLDYVPVEQARAMSGLRIAFVRGLPGVWGIAIKAILDIKGIDYIAVPHEPGEANELLKEWTGQTSAPVAMFNDDRPRPHWSEMLALAEQLQPVPPLIPDDEDKRMAMFGICHEICSEDGFGWNLRLLLLGEHDPAGDERTNALRAKYRSPVTQDYARRRLSSIVYSLARALDRQAIEGKRYFMGDDLTAADIYWAAFSNLLVPMAEDLCTMPDFFRDQGPVAQQHLQAPLPQILLDHRDHVVREYFRIPIAF
ncbi:glutathione S-transferase family protein [Rhizorhabdus argentea]|uniref:hypothetical protein n=1 Tax=Rhizorhabdus argentea TaxID=1387174 RepID=UPI0030ED4D95